MGASKTLGIGTQSLAVQRDMTGLTLQATPPAFNSKPENLIPRHRC